MKYLFFLLSIFGTIFAMTSCGNGVDSKNTTNVDTKSGIDSSKLFVVNLPVDKTEQTKFDTIKLGRILEGEVVESNFILKNDSEKAIAIESVVTGCGCVTAAFDKSAIKSNGDRIVTIKYNSKGQFGTQMKAVEIVTTEHNTARIYVSCTVIEK